MNEIRDVKEAIQNIYFFYDDLIGLAYKFSFLGLIKKTWHLSSSLLYNLCSKQRLVLFDNSGGNGDLVLP